MEVLTKKKVPSGVWRGAEIVADNGESYTVRHYRRPGVLSDVVEKVSVEAVRPCPPRGNGPVIWDVGDIVEVLDNGYWKTAEIQQVMDGGYYHIHLIGSIDEFRVEKSSIRARQEWLDNRWVLIEKDSGIRKDMICRAFKKDHAHYGLESAISKSRKRLSPDNSAFVEAQPECVQKRRAIEKDELEIMHGDSYSFNGKVDTCADPRENQVKHNVEILTKKRTAFNNADHKNQDNARCLPRTSGSEDCISSVSSIASCSVINAIPERLLSHSSAGCSQDSDSLCSDAESFECFGVEGGVSACQSKGEYALRVHERELDTYRYILEALYESGPLSWEQEAILTNLRIRLYVSNDEHLMELRRLKSIGNLQDMYRHVSLTATCAKMMLWLANSLLASRKGHHLCLLLADKAIGV